MKKKTIPDDEKLEALMRGAGPRTPLPDDIRHRMEATFRRELSQTQRNFRLRRVSAIAGIAATLLVAILLYVNPTTNQGRPIVADTTGQTGETTWRYEDESGPLRSGNVIRVNDVLRTGDGSVSLLLADSAIDIRLAPMSEITFSGPDELHVLAGAVYIDSGGDSHPLTVTAGEVYVQHIGTQYVVSKQDMEIEVAVREGEITITHAKDIASARASAGKAQLMVFSSDGRRETSMIEAFDDRFIWAAKLSPSITTDGLPINDFFQWVGRQTGYRVVYTSEALASLTRSETIVGNFNTSDALSALGKVERTTPFNTLVDHEAGTITIGD